MKAINHQKYNTPQFPFLEYKVLACTSIKVLHVGLFFNLLEPCSGVHVSSRCIQIQCHNPLLTPCEKFSTECPLTLLPSSLKTSFPLVNVLHERKLSLLSLVLVIMSYQAFRLVI